VSRRPTTDALRAASDRKLDIFRTPPQTILAQKLMVERRPHLDELTAHITVRSHACPYQFQIPRIESAARTIIDELGSPPSLKLSQQHLVRADAPSQHYGHMYHGRDADDSNQTLHD
jgi:hypothetical protein